MHRRSFFQQLLALLGLSSGAGGIATASPSSTPGGLPLSHGLPPNPPWLEDRLRLPMLPLHRPEDFADCPDLRVHDLAAALLARLSEGASFAFRYHGGSEPGTVRSALPVLLFRKTAPDLPGEIPDEGAIYLLAHCQTRQASRTFRLDRMELVPDASHTISPIRHP